MSQRRPGPKLTGQRRNGLEAEDDDAGEQRRACHGRDRRVADRRRSGGGGDQQEREHECPSVGVGRLGLAVEPIGNGAQPGNNRHRHREEQGVEGESVCAEVVRKRGGEDEGDR